jgi:hypothetical protein
MNVPLQLILCIVLFAIGIWLLFSRFDRPVKGLHFTGSASILCMLASVYFATQWQQGELQSLQKGNEELRKDLGLRTRELHQTQIDLNNANTDLQNTRTQILDNSAKFNAQLQDERKTYSEALIGKQGEIDQKQGEIDQKQAEINQQQREMQGEIDQKINQISKLDQEKGTLSSEREKLTSQLGEWQSIAKAGWETIGEIALSPAQKEELSNLQNGIQRVNQELQLVQLARYPYLYIEGQTAIATYVIFRKSISHSDAGIAAGLESLRGAGLFDFAPQKYWISGDSQGKLGGTLLDEVVDLVCKGIKSTLLREVSERQAIEALPSLKDLPDSKPLISQLHEVAYAVSQLQLKAGTGQVYIMGCGDGGGPKWEHELERIPNQIKMLEAINPQPTPPFTFRNEETSRRIGREENDHGKTYYTNEDLPELRAAAVARILEPVLNCPSFIPDAPANQIPVKILQGYVNPPDRKARVYLVVSLNK